MNRLILDFERPIIELQDKIDELEQLSRNGDNSLAKEIARLRSKAGKMREEVYSKLSRWQIVQLARHPQRPYTLDYIDHIAAEFTELHGDRSFRDDQSIVAGIGRIDGDPVVIIGHQKGRGTRANLQRNFGMPHPEGYRKAMRIMQLAEKFGVPVLTLIDTPGAYPGLGAEERGQAAAIADNLMFMARLRTPVVAVIIGEGGSGGALALGVADRVLMMQYAIYSVISPEGCASILYRDASHASEAADAMRISAADLLGFKVVDSVIPEPLGGAHNDIPAAAAALAAAIAPELKALKAMEAESLVAARIARYAAMGQWLEA